jgi:hypothetical protein
MGTMPCLSGWPMIRASPSISISNDVVHALCADASVHM